MGNKPVIRVNVGNGRIVSYGGATIECHTKQQFLYHHFAALSSCMHLASSVTLEIIKDIKNEADSLYGNEEQGQYWQEFFAKEIWQIHRMHMSEIEIDFKFSPDYGVPMWTVYLKIKKKLELLDQGTHLWKRLEKVYQVLKQHYPMG